MEIAVAYSEFHASLLAYVRSKIKSKEDAEDIVQNIFARISANANALSGKEKVQNWLFTITRNAVIDYYRANSKRKNIELAESFAHELPDVADSNATNDLDDCVGVMIALLPDEYRGIIQDAEINDISQKDLAVKYGMAYPSLRSRVQRGRERLKQLFHNCCVIKTDKHGNVLDVEGRGDCERPCQPQQ